MNAIFQVKDFKRACGTCSLRELCLPYGIGEEDLSRLEHLVQRMPTVHRGAHLFRQGDPLKAIFAIRTGSIKSITLGADGAEQITGFHFPGELVGLDAIAADTHDCSAIGLEDSSLCATTSPRFE